MREMNRKEITFIGKITGGVTHEINNALASIKEISGLMEDLISMSSTDSFPQQEKFIKIIPRIREQVERSIKLSKQLNKFSHLTDERIIQVELNSFIDLLVFLTQRFARMKNVELQYLPTDREVNLNTVPVQLQMAFYNCILYFLNNATEAGGKITIHPVINEQQFSIKINFDGELTNKNNLFQDLAVAEELLILREVITSLDGTTGFDQSTQSIVLNFMTKQK
jgi:two-component system NtrC family sensor kinase